VRNEKKVIQIEKQNNQHHFQKFPLHHRYTEKPETPVKIRRGKHWNHQKQRHQNAVDEDFFCHFFGLKG